MDSSSSTINVDTSSKTPKPRGRRRASTNAPKKNHLLSPPPAKRLLCSTSPSQNMTPNNFVNHGYTPFENNFNGYKCRFLCREFHFILKFFSQQLLFTKNESLAVFTLSEYYRQFCENQIGTLLNPWVNGDVKPINPFSTDQRYNFKPLFIRLSTSCTYYYKKEELAAIQCSKFERHMQGKCFAGRAAIVVKGIKFSADGKEVSPMLHVCQVLEHDYLPKATVDDAVRDTCILEDENVIPTAAMKADTDSISAEDEAAIIAYIEAESRRLDEEGDSAYASIN
jgi:hypothetical protein